MGREWTTSIYVQVAIKESDKITQRSSWEIWEIYIIAEEPKGDMAALLRRSLNNGGSSEKVSREIMHATHVEILISAKSPIVDKMRLTRMRTETPTNYQEEVVHGDHAFFLLCLCPTLEEIEPAPQPHLLQAPEAQFLQGEERKLVLGQVQVLSFKMTKINFLLLTALLRYN